MSHKTDLNNNFESDVDDILMLKITLVVFKNYLKRYMFISNHPNLSQFLNFVNGILFVIIAFYMISEKH